MCVTRSSNARHSARVRSSEAARHRSGRRASWHEAERSTGCSTRREWIPGQSTRSRPSTTSPSTTPIRTRLGPHVFAVIKVGARSSGTTAHDTGTTARRPDRPGPGHRHRMSVLAAGKGHLGVGFRRSACVAVADSLPGRRPRPRTQRCEYRAAERSRHRQVLGRARNPFTPRPFACRVRSAAAACMRVAGSRYRRPEPGANRRR